MKVYCPLCRTWWNYRGNRKVVRGNGKTEFAKPTPNNRLTCDDCQINSKWQAEDGDDRLSKRHDRMDDDDLA